MRGKCNHISNSDYTFPRIIQKYIQNFQISQDYIFDILQCFAIKLYNFTKFTMLFLAVLMNIPNSKVCLKGEWSIATMCNIYDIEHLNYFDFITLLYGSKF